MTQVFLSYAHDDRQRLEKSLVHLGPVFDDLGLKFWWDNSLTGGAHWHANIRKAIDASDVFVLYVTPQFVNSEYIKSHELPAIAQAHRERSALVIPLYVEDCLWKLRFQIFKNDGDMNDTPLQALPQDANGALKAVAKWKPQASGWHAISKCLDPHLRTYLQSQPKRPESGPIRMRPTADGFILTPGDGQITQPLTETQVDLIKGLDERIEEITGFNNRLGNCAPELVKAIHSYHGALHVIPVNWTNLWMAGNDLNAEISDTPLGKLRRVFNDDDAHKLHKSLKKLTPGHNALIMSHPDGIRLISNAMAAAGLSAKNRHATAGALNALVPREGLYSGETRARGNLLRAELEAGGTDASRVAEATAFAMATLSGIGEILENSAEAALTKAQPVDPQSLDNLQRVSLAVLTEAPKPIAAFSQGNRDLRRYVSWLVKAVQGQRPRLPFPKAAGDLGSEYDGDVVKALILDGKSPPRAWMPFVTKLDLSETSLTDLSPLKGLSLLKELSVRGTSVNDLSPLSGLTALRELSVTDTQVSDLSPLKDLTALKELSFSYTQVNDLSPLKGLKKLTELAFHNTQVSDLSPLSNLKAIVGLYLNTTHVSDLSPIKDFKAVERLNFSNTKVSDLSPINKFNKLKGLWFADTLVSDLTPINQLSALQHLRLERTQVSDLYPIQNAKYLQNIWLDNTSVNDLSPLENLTALRRLSASHTQVSDLSPLKNMIALESLKVGNTQINDLSSIKNLMALEDLWLNDTQVSDLSALRNLTQLEMLDFEGLTIKRLPESWPKNLKEVNLYRCGWPDNALHPPHISLITPTGTWLGEDRPHGALKISFNRIQRQLRGEPEEDEA